MTFRLALDLKGYCHFWCLVPGGKGLTNRVKLENNDGVQKK